MNYIDNPRGLLANCPPDVVMVINGLPVTRADVLRGKQERQVRQLARKRQSFGDVIKPGLVWVFDNGPIIPYGGRWLYVRTLKQDWQIRDNDMKLKIMRVFPCGLLPMIENYKLWQDRFIEFYRRPNCNRPQGLANCQVEISYSRQIVNVRRELA